MRFLPLLSSLLLVLNSDMAGAQPFLSHPPQRPLPGPSARPLGKGPARFVDAARGDDANPGSLEKPWRTVQHGVQQLQPGDTLYLRGGTYYEHVTVRRSGTAEKPITLRSYPGELAILDGGLREFFESPATAWLPCPGGVEGEFWSAKSYPDLGGTEGSTNVLGRFGDSMVPLHGYRLLSDFRSNNVYWHANIRADNDKDGIYCGPGLFYDLATGRIHVRLAHTNMKYLPAEDNYRGVTDPRKVPLVIAGLKGGPTLTLRDCRFVAVQDLVVRGARLAAIDISACANLLFDGVTAYGGASAFHVKDTIGLGVVHSACRGIAAPWTFRGSLKYRAFEARIFSASGWSPTGVDNRDFELAYSEFTDCVDGIFLGNVHNVQFHHNLVDNITDDGIFLTAGTGYDGVTHGGNVHIFQNRLSRCLTTFAFGVGHGRQKYLANGRQTGAGVFIYRNVFDYRRPVLYHQPGGPDQPQEVTSTGRIASDHGSPLWEPMDIYHNTIVADDPKGYSYGALGLGNAVGAGTKRRVFNNIVVQMKTLPGTTFPPSTTDFQTDGNLHWSVAAGPMFQGDIFAKFRKSKAFDESKRRYPPGWGAADRFADPKFVSLAPDWKSTPDLRLRPGSPAIDAGVDLPQAWPDPLRHLDKGKPDIGAVPAGASAWVIGVRGRFHVFGGTATASKQQDTQPFAVPNVKIRPPLEVKPAAIVEGYPEFDAPLLQYALRKQGVPVHSERAWLDPKEYPKHSLVILAGDLQRAALKTTTYSEADLQAVKQFLEDGGVLWLVRRGKRVFDGTPAGRKFLQELTGPVPQETEQRILIFKHPWVAHLDAAAPHPWLAWPKDRDVQPLQSIQGDRPLSSPAGTCLLWQRRVGKGRLIYLGWQVSASLPAGKKPTTPEQERLYEEQMQVLLNIAEDLYGRAADKKAGGW